MNIIKKISFPIFALVVLLTLINCIQQKSDYLEEKEEISFVDKYKHIALKHEREYHIPWVITMGQAILESEEGKSTMARESCNFFGIKCKTKCLDCTCRNYSDDTKYDMFRVFNSPEESFDEHLRVLLKPRYARAFQMGKNYKKWAHEIKKAGYATDPNYAEKLIKVIETRILNVV